MQIIRDDTKNDIVKQRIGWWGVGFEDVIAYLKDHQPLIDQRNDTPWYEWQGMRIILINNYPYKVPYQYIWNDTIKLITVFPCRDYKHVQ